MAPFQHYPHLLTSTPSPSEGVTLHREGTWRQASRSNLDQEMFGQAPDTPTPHNTSPLHSESSSMRTLPTHTSLLSPYNNLRASSRSQSSLPGSSTTMTSAAPTSSQPVQSGYPPGTQPDYSPVNTTRHRKAQSEGVGPASDRRSLGRWGRLRKFFRIPFRALLCIRPERSERFPSGSLENLTLRVPPVALDLTTIQQRLPPQETSADSEKPSSIRAQNNSDTQIPLSPSSLDAFEGSSPRRDCHDPPVTPSDGAYKEGARMEAVIGTPGQRPSADQGLSMPATSPNSVPPSSNTSAEPPLFTKTLYAEPDEQEPGHNTDVDHGGGAGACHRPDEYKPRRNVSESDGGGYNGPAPRKSMSKNSFLTMGTSSIGSNSDDGQNDGHRSVKVFMEGIPE